jgi:hypothetical protein
VDDENDDKLCAANRSLPTWPRAPINLQLLARGGEGQIIKREHCEEEMTGEKEREKGRWLGLEVGFQYNKLRGSNCS